MNGLYIGLLQAAALPEICASGLMREEIIHQEGHDSWLLISVSLLPIPKLQVKHLAFHTICTHICNLVQETWQEEIDADLEALAERKLVQATKERQYLQQRQASRQAVLSEEGPSMREQLRDKVCRSLSAIIPALAHERWI